MKRTELEELIRETIVEILSEVDTDKTRGTAVVPLGTDPSQVKKYTDKGIDVEFKKGQMAMEAKDEEEIEDTYGKEDEDDKKDAKIANAEPSKAELKKLDKEFGSSKFAKKLSPADKERLDKLEAGIKKKLANPTKDNIEIVRQLIKKPEIKKLFKDGGKDLKALISDIIR